MKESPPENYAMTIELMLLIRFMSRACCLPSFFAVPEMFLKNSMARLKLGQLELPVFRFTEI
jgi:hypothetical protein